MGHGGDVITELTTDHQEVEELFVRIQELPPGDPERKRLADQAVMELVRHAVAEEEYLYPAVREYLPDGDSLADKELEDHAAAERTMKELEECDADHPRFDTMIAQLMAEVREHVADEEADLLPRLRAACSQEKLEELGEKVRQAKKMAPTRPHPAAPDKPPANKLLDRGAGMVDRLRDTLTGRGKQG
ncbi:MULTISPECIES: hemerythrin domain-containing protein [Streptomyces]|uniref:Hemerythrin domain-containing protein n=1 Tax=Streptomyces sudanensis TaxID=436397 RepID=A0ABY4TLC4_9ACTN|nr:MULTISPECIES: hemerythrin domain-containing protein [Streptomyces]URN17582.1 hemerythrin domain-containing protein [Streptomyces sudanensis]